MAPHADYPPGFLASAFWEKVARCVVIALAGTCALQAGCGSRIDDANGGAEMADYPLEARKKLSELNRLNREYVTDSRYDVGRVP
jgi:hypothetical protein